MLNIMKMTIRIIFEVVLAVAILAVSTFFALVFESMFDHAGISLFVFCSVALLLTTSRILTHKFLKS